MSSVVGNLSRSFHDEKRITRQTHHDLGYEYAPHIDSIGILSGWLDMYRTFGDRFRREILLLEYPNEQPEKLL